MPKPIEIGFLICGFLIVHLSCADEYTTPTIPLEIARIVCGPTHFYDVGKVNKLPKKITALVAESPKQVAGIYEWLNASDTEKAQKWTAWLDWAYTDGEYYLLQYHRREPKLLNEFLVAVLHPHDKQATVLWRDNTDWHGGFGEVMYRARILTDPVAADNARYRENQKPTPDTDSWFRSDPPFWPRSKGKEISKSEFSAVLSERIPEAEKDLLESSVLEVSAIRASLLTGRDLEGVEGNKFFLVRGLTQNIGTGGFWLVLFNHQLMVESAQLGLNSGPMHRQPLVVSLPEMPQDVFVTCGGGAI